MQPLPWSHSSIEGFETCGRQYEELKVLRNFQDQKNDASIWGDQVHIAMEKYLQSGEALPANMVQYVDYLDKFKARPGRLLAEQKYGIDINLRPCSFYDKGVWGRGIVDVLQLDGSVAHVDDHKTGKNRKKNMQQLIIFALLVFLHHPEIKTVVCTFHWLQLGMSDSEVFNRADMPAMWETLIPKLERYARAFHMGVFQAKPSGLCKKHCAVNTCEHWGSGRR